MSYTPPSRLAEALSRVFFPRAWIMLHPYNPEWDRYIRVALALGMVKPYALSAQTITNMAVTIGDNLIWTGNYPFAYALSGWPYERRVTRPSFATIRLLKQLTEQWRKTCSQSDAS